MKVKQTAIEIVKTLQKHGYKAFFAGGCVRDMIMGKESEDYDIATSALPQDIINLFEDHSCRCAVWRSHCRQRGSQLRGGYLSHGRFLQ